MNWCTAKTLLRMSNKQQKYSASFSGVTFDRNVYDMESGLYNNSGKQAHNNVSCYLTIFCQILFHHSQKEMEDDNRSYYEWFQCDPSLYSWFYFILVRIITPHLPPPYYA
jgi:hypothetical protein